MDVGVYGGFVDPLESIDVVIDLGDRLQCAACSVVTGRDGRVTRPAALRADDVVTVADPVTGRPLGHDRACPWLRAHPDEARSARQPR